MENLSIDRAPYGRLRESDGTNSTRVPAEYNGNTYYDLPALNPSHYGQLVATYLFIGGIAGASQVIATIVDLRGSGKTQFVVRAGRYLAIAGMVSGPAFLIADLHVPERWYNMLRIFRRTSSMSIGSWTLAFFGTMSALTAAAQFLADRSGSRRYLRVARLLSLPATAGGAVVATYTGTLLGAPSTPFWAAASRLLPALFGTSAVVTSTAALSSAAELADANVDVKKGLRRLAIIGGAVELLIESALERSLKEKKVDTPLNDSRITAAQSFGYKGLGLVAPLIINSLILLSGRRSRRLSLAASAAALVGGYIMRSVMLAAGRKSADYPRDYFNYTKD